MADTSAPSVEETEQARSSDIDPGTFDSSSYRILRKFLPHQQIIDAMRPAESRHGAGIPIEYLHQALANNRGNYDYAVAEAESYLDRDLVQAQANRSAFLGSRSSTISQALSNTMLTQEDHDSICDHLVAHHAKLAQRSGSLPESVDLFGRMVASVESPENLIDNIEKWDGNDYPGAHEWQQSEIGKLKTGSVIHAGINTESGATNLLSEYDIFNHINHAIHNGEQMNIKYRGKSDFDTRARSIVPTHAWMDPQRGSLYVRAYDPNAVNADGMPGGWRTFRGSGISGMSSRYPKAVELPEDTDAPEIDSKLRSMFFDGHTTSLEEPRATSSEHCSCGTADGLHTVGCYQSMASKLVKHYTAQLVSACASPSAGETPKIISPQTLSNLVATKRKLAIATQASESAFFPYAYSKDRHGK